MTILYSCNANYINQTIISMYSVIEHHMESIEFILICDRVLELDKKRIKELVETAVSRAERKGSDQARVQVENPRYRQIENLINRQTESESRIENGTEQRKRISYQVRFVDLDSIPELREVYTDGIHPRSIYAKLFPDRLTDAERILYLDSDVVANAAFSELFSIDLKKNIIAGVKMPYSASTLARQGIKGDIFICDGMVLIDVKQWKRKQISRKIQEYMRRCDGKPERMSESVLNFICAGHILVLPPKYHLMPQFLLFRSRELKKMYQIKEYYSSQEMEEARKHPILIHYMNELYNRPWCKNSKNQMWNHPYQALYMAYQKKLGICQKEKESLSVRTKITRYSYKMLPFPVFLLLFHRIHRN